MHCDGKLNLRSHFTSNCLIEMVAKAGLTIILIHVLETWLAGHELSRLLTSDYKPNTTYIVFCPHTHLQMPSHYQRLHWLARLKWNNWKCGRIDQYCENLFSYILEICLADRWLLILNLTPLTWFHASSV
jgi:hypothetical protein